MRWLLFTLVLAGCTSGKDPASDDSDAPNNDTQETGDTATTDDSGGTQPVDADQDGATSDVDCDDNNPAVNPSATEVCDGIDNNCDLQIDEGVTSTFLTDADGDTFGDDAAPVEACTAGAGLATEGGDCDDNNPDINPLAVETTDGVDNNCNGQTDESGSLARYYYDGDQDGFGDPDSYLDLTSQPAGYVTDHTDCDDADPNINPDAVEIEGNGLDDNCDGQVDEGGGGTNRYYADTDGDGYGNASIYQDAAAPPAGYVTDSSDCDDSDVAVNPGETEVCDGFDNDCDALIDDLDSSLDVSTKTRYYSDADSDGYGDPTAYRDMCSASSGFPTSTNGDDCDDTDAAINPGAAEVASNGVDDNCNGQTDETGTASTWYADSDGDSYGNAAVSMSSVSQPVGYVSNSTDCDDTRSSVNPGATEVASNNIDDNCNGQTDEAATVSTWYADTDADGYGNSAISMSSVSQPVGFVSNSTDCNDSNTAINPGATEICDTLDNDCDSLADEQDSSLDVSTKTRYYADTDADTYGDPAVYRDLCSAGANFPASTNGNDCDDTDAAVNPAASEVASNGIDDNCNGQVDESGSGSTWYADSDGDSYGNASVSVTSVSQPVGYVSNSTDCDDTRSTVNPGATEVASNSIDDNCNGQTDETASASNWYADTDSDGYGNPLATISSTTQPIGYVSNNTDCDDANANANPGETEVCDGVDNDCDSLSDNADSSLDQSTQTRYYYDSDGDGYGNPSRYRDLCSSVPNASTIGTDCNDSSASVHPGAAEVIGNGVDDNCDGTIQ